MGYYMYCKYSKAIKAVCSTYTPDGTTVVLSGSLTGTELYFVILRLQTVHATTL